MSESMQGSKPVVFWMFPIILLCLSYLENLFNECFLIDEETFIFLDYETFIDLSKSPFLPSTNQSCDLVLDPSLLNFFIDSSQESTEFFLPIDSQKLQTICEYPIFNVTTYYPEPQEVHLGVIYVSLHPTLLWLTFIFLIFFYFISYLCIVQYCNLRLRSLRRDSQRFNRSKCGDFFIGVSPLVWAFWATADDFIDLTADHFNFGNLNATDMIQLDTTDMIIKTNEYGWGWEYYYPKNLDLNCNIKKNYSVFIANSLKYGKISNVNNTNTNVWDFSQNKQYDFVVTPTHPLLLPIDNYKTLNFFYLNDAKKNSFYQLSLHKQILILSKFFIHDIVFNPV